MTLWTSEEIAAAVGAERRGEWSAARVVTDSRKLREGDLFVALVGEHFDGHDFVAQALAQGAAGALVSRLPEGLASDARLILVSDTLTALQKLGEAGRSRSGALVAGVTGSVGKTSCKEALALALARQALTYASIGNLNNHIGLPLMLANLPPETEVAVIEMGMNHAGEIELLSKIARPDAAIITAVEAAHLEFFASVAEIADAKAEICAGMAPDAMLVIPADNPHAARLREQAAGYGITHLLAFGERPDADYRLVSYRPTPQGCEAQITTVRGLMNVTLGATGLHWALMAAGVLAMVEALGYDVAAAAEALAGFREPEGRGRAYEVRLSGGRQVTVLDDSYNASPASMRAAFSRLEDIWQARGGVGRKLAALGDMRELGEQSQALHAGLAEGLQRHAVDRLYAAGPYMHFLYDAMPPETRGAWRDEAGKLSDAITSDLVDGDLLLVKGSRGSRMDKVVSAVLSAEERPDEEKNRAHAV